MKRILIPVLVLLILTGCSLIGNKDRLNETDLRYIENLGLLDKNENVLIFSSSFTKKTSGNFVTNKRIAAYWMDSDKKEYIKDFAFFKDIVHIDSVDLTQSLTYASYLVITRKDGTTFKVHVSGNKKKFQLFVKLAVDHWKTNKRLK